VICSRFPGTEPPYAGSVLALFPDILQQIQSEETTVEQVYQLALERGWDLANFFSALDCLYAMNRISLDEERKVLRYVEMDEV
jgi:hypothetical protein